MTHADAVAWWQTAEGGFALLCTVGCYLILTAKRLRYRAIGMVLLVVTYATWVVAYRIADDYRTVNQMRP